MVDQQQIQLSASTIKYLFISLSVLSGLVMVSQAEVTGRVIGADATGFLTVLAAAAQVVIQGVLARSVGKAVERVGEAAEASEAAAARASNAAVQILHSSEPQPPKRTLPPLH